MRSNVVKNEHLFANPRKKRVVILEDLDFIWDTPELNDLAKMWEQGESISSMEKHFKRDQDEVFLGLFHLSRRNKISFRKGSIFGTK
ncbi:hypothetical protein NST02_23520 [Robertmurraya sp. FSL W8-0741]|uniref:hypothetical protein n=1 Tax=Robertmurraya sp. FSL W8-0741 TaxID=2954629 RepID=UPI0030F9E612